MAESKPIQEEQGVNSPRYRIVQKEFHHIIKVVAPSVADVAWAVFSKNLIPKAKLDEVEAADGRSNRSKASTVIRVILDGIENHEDHFDSFLSILQQFPTMKSLSEYLSKELSSLMYEERIAFRDQYMTREQHGKSVLDTNEMDSGKASSVVEPLSESVDYPSHTDLVSGVTNQMKQIGLSSTHRHAQLMVTNQQSIGQAKLATRCTSSNSTGLVSRHSHSTDDTVPSKFAGTMLEEQHISAAPTLRPFTETQSEHPIVYSTNSGEVYPVPESQVSMQPPQPVRFNIGSDTNETNEQEQPLVVNDNAEVYSCYPNESAKKSEQIAYLKTQLSESKSQVKELENEKAAVALQRDKTEIELEKLKEVHREALKEKDAMVASLRQKEEAIEEVVNRLSEKEKENELLKEKYEKEIRELKEVHDVEVNRLNMEIMKLQLSESKLEVKLERAKSDAKDVEIKLERAKRETAEYKAELAEEKCKSFESQKNESDKALKEKDAEIARLKLQNSLNSN